MKATWTCIGIAIAFVLIVSFANPVLAVEGALGRPISGASINPYAGLVPPEPGFAVTIGEAYYDGSISGAVPTKIPATNYQNGILSDLEATVIKRFKCGAGIGVIGSWLAEVNDDTG